MAVDSCLYGSGQLFTHKKQCADRLFSPARPDERVREVADKVDGDADEQRAAHALHNTDLFIQQRKANTLQDEQRGLLKECTRSARGRWREGS